MTAQIGSDGLDCRGDPRQDLLIKVARVQPDGDLDWVNLQTHFGFRSTRRLRITDDPLAVGGVVVATWPAELKPQALYLYGRGLGSALVAAARERGWTVEPSPHIAYWPARGPDRRLYMCPSVAHLDNYLACWEDEDALRRVGNHTREEVTRELWPWLKQQGFADDADDTVLLRFLDEILPRKRPAQMRPGLRFRRAWTPAEVATLGPSLAEIIRSDFDAVFTVADEPALGSAGLGG